MLFDYVCDFVKWVTLDWRVRGPFSRRLFYCYWGEGKRGGRGCVAAYGQRDDERVCVSFRDQPADVEDNTVLIVLGLVFHFHIDISLGV